MDPLNISARTFRHLCRSSPWRWQTLRFELRQNFPAARGGGPGTSWRPEHPGASAPVTEMKCWVRRPGALRVETLDGALLASTTKINESRDSLFISGSRKPWLLPPALVNPVRDDDGFVVRRPEALYGEPAYGTGRAAAALDPVELAGEKPVALESPFANVAEVSTIGRVQHNGRETLEAILTPNASYRPVFDHAPLLFPGRTAVRVDVATGICVATRSLDGPTAGAGHRMVILGVDEYMLDDLFEEVSMGLTDVSTHIPWDLGPAR